MSNIFRSIQTLAKNKCNLLARINLKSRQTLSSVSTIDEKVHLGPMLDHQRSLLRQPVPPLKLSLDKYLLSLEPLLSAEELAKTRNLAEQFAESEGIGEKLHAFLVERAKNTKNWLSDWWLQCAYLEFRSPVVVYSNPGLILPEQKFKDRVDQIQYAAQLIAAALDYKLQIDDCKLNAEKAGADYLDMSQYQKIFSTCRIPDSPKDKLAHYNDPSRKTPRHIVVVNNNQYFRVDVIDSNGKALSQNQIANQLKNVIEQSKHIGEPIGLLTTQNRQSWAESYQRLISENAESVLTIQKCIFLVCLDQAAPISKSPNYLTHAGLQTLHGDYINSGNRWYDKTIQFIVSQDGVVGLTYEHSPSEGPPVANLTDYIVSCIEKQGSTYQWSSAVEAPIPERIQFQLSDESKKDIEMARVMLDTLIKDLDLNCFSFGAFGREFIKSQKLSPDSFIQIAIQLAFYKLHNQVGATYESATLRKFLYGRTETIRSVSNESKLFCESATLGRSLLEQTEALKNAIKAHKNYVNDAVNGTGVDRLLLGMKLMAIEKGLEIPDLFKDTGFVKSTHFKLTTSQVPAKSDALMCYGAAAPDGYGCCYNPQANSINFAVSSFNSCTDTNANNFKDALEESLTQMHDMLARSQLSKL